MWKSDLISDETSVPKPLSNISDDGASEADIIFLYDQMFRFARLQLRDAHLAEDAVQEAIIAALQAKHRFHGLSSLRTWVFSILKNKIANQLRQSPPWIRLSEMMDLADEGSRDDQVLLERLFNENHHWQPVHRPARWHDPNSQLEDNDFWRVFEACLSNLPEAQSRVFMMREFVELETHEICVATGATLTNLNVMLHRARLRLRNCLESNWFEQEVR